MTESKEVRVPHSEVAVVLRCGTCEAETAINLANAQQRQRFEAGRSVSCGVCGTGFHGSLQSALLLLAKAFSSVQESKQTLHFRIRVDERGTNP